MDDVDDPDGCRGIGAALGAASFGLIGAGVGALVGATAGDTDVWEEVPLERVKIGMSIQNYSVGIAR